MIYCWESCLVSRVIQSCTFCFVMVFGYDDNFCIISCLLYHRWLSDLMIFLIRAFFWSMTLRSWGLNFSLSSTKILFAVFGHIHWIDWKNLMSLSFSACLIFCWSRWASPNAVFGHIPDIFIIFSKIFFCSWQSKQKYFMVFCVSSI
jgi:hypothetical protein